MGLSKLRSHLGKDGEIGAVRTIGHSVIVGQTRYSYTYTQPLRGTGLYPMYHGTLEARPLGSGARPSTTRWSGIAPRSQTIARGKSRSKPTGCSLRRCSAT